MIELERNAAMKDYQRYVHELERLHGWLDVDLVHSCFLMGEEVGELFKAVRRARKMFEQGGSEQRGSESSAEADTRRDEVADEIVDVLNYLLAIANRLDIDVEEAFRAKNARNQERSWGAKGG